MQCGAWYFVRHETPARMPLLHASARPPISLLTRPPHPCNALVSGAHVPNRGLVTRHSWHTARLRSAWVACGCYACSRDDPPSSWTALRPPQLASPRIPPRVCLHAPRPRRHTPRALRLAKDWLRLRDIINKARLVCSETSTWHHVSCLLRAPWLRVSWGRDRRIIAGLCLGRSL